MTLSPDQCRAARGLLEWSADELARQAKIGVATVRRFETGDAVREASVEAMRLALEAGGLIFIAASSTSARGGEGVRKA